MADGEKTNEKNGVKIKLATVISVVAVLAIIVFGLSGVISTRASKAQVNGIEKNLCKDIEKNALEIKAVELRRKEKVLNVEKNMEKHLGSISASIDKIGTAIEKINTRQGKMKTTQTRIKTLVETHIENNGG